MRGGFQRRTPIFAVRPGVDSVGAVRRVLVTTLASVAVLAGVGGGAIYAKGVLLPPGRALPGTKLADTVQPEDKTTREWVESLRTPALAREIAVNHPAGSEALALADLGAEIDVDATVDRLMRAAEDGSLLERVQRAWRVRQDGAVAALEYRFDEDRARATLTTLAPQIHRDPVDAWLDLVAHQRTRHEFGQDLDVEATLAGLRQRTLTTDTPVVAATSPLAPQLYDFMLPNVDVSKVLGERQSKFRGTGWGRGRNITVAARYLNGTVIEPGKTVSFNKVVGLREKKRGFVEAPVIVKDEFEKGVGGGTCQAASTLHAAAVFGMLDVVRRRSHSRATGYIPLGLDAVVIDEEVDLRLRNPYDVPLMIHAFIPEKGVIRVEILGHELAGEVKYRYGVVEKLETYRRITTKPDLESGKHDQRQEGKIGFDILSTVELVSGDERLAKKTYDSRYWPVPEVYWVAPDFDLSELPETDENCAYVEVDGVRLGEEGAENEGLDGEAAANEGLDREAPTIDGADAAPAPALDNGNPAAVENVSDRVPARDTPAGADPSEREQPDTPSAN
jgi:vancomycin resistance protein YoaR